MKNFRKSTRSIIFIFSVFLIQNFLSASESMADERKKVLFYRNPMRGDIHSPVPAKDEMGMEYIPVYEGEEGGVTTVAGHATVTVDSEKQRLIGIKTAVVERKPLKKMIRVLGIVGHEEMLFDAQIEYLKALRNAPNAIREQYSGVYQKQFAPTAVESAKLKLMQLGMDEASIAEINKDSPPDKRFLHLSQHGDDWVSFTLYEYEAPLVKRGDKVEVEIPSTPGLKLMGQVQMISPFADESSRTIKGRALVQDENHVLKPQMSVTVLVNAEMGEGLAVPADAVLLTGTRSVVYVEGKNGVFEPREVVVGAQAGEFYEIKQGLSEGEKVAVSGNFLIDSESRMNSASSAS